MKRGWTFVLAVAWALVLAPVGHAVDLQPTDDLDLDPDLDVDLPDLPLVGASGPDSSNTEEHMPIRIHGDKEFDLPTSGVVEGNGTADDPYVIRGWEITPTVFGVEADMDVSGGSCSPQETVDVGGWPPGFEVERHAIEIVDTTAHVTIEANYLHTRPDEGWRSSDGLDGIFLQNADHVTIRHNRIGNTSEDPLQRGVCAEDASDLAVEGTTIRNTVEYPFDAWQGTNLELVGNTLDVPAVDRVEGIRIRNAQGVEIGGNIIQDQAASAMILDGTAGLWVHNNTIERSDAHGIDLVGTDNVVVERNEIVDHPIDGMFVTSSSNVRVHHNNLDQNGDDGLDNGRLETNATMNWWGCPDGPDDADCDDVEGNVVYDPWRSSPVGDAGAS